MTKTISPVTRSAAVLAAVRRLPTAAYAALATHEPMVRRVLAANPDCPAPVRDRLLRDRDALVRRNATAALTDPDQLADVLHGRPNSRSHRHATERYSRLDAATVTGRLGVSVTDGVAANPLTPPTLLAELTRSETGDARWRAMANPATPTDAVLDAVRRLPSMRSLLGAGPYAVQFVRASTVVLAHREVCALWAESPNTAAVRAVARHPDLPVEVAERILAGRTFAGKPALALNPAVPADLLTGTLVGRREKLADLPGRAELAADPGASALTVEDALRLAAAGSDTLDWLLVTNRQDLCTAPVIDAYVRRRTPNTDAHTFAVLAAEHPLTTTHACGGPGGLGGSLMSGTHKQAASLLAPVMWDEDAGRHGLPDPVTLRGLPDDVDFWQVLLAATGRGAVTTELADALRTALDSDQPAS